MFLFASFFLGLAALSDMKEHPFIGSRDVRLGPYLVRFEFWCESCLDRGVGPWSDEGGGLEGIPAELRDRIEVYAEEFLLRCELPSYDRDAPPEGAGRLVHSGFIPLKKPLHGGAFLYDTIQVAIWEATA